jgi:hypothetical protein
MAAAPPAWVERINAGGSDFLELSTGTIAPPLNGTFEGFNSNQSTVDFESSEKRRKQL